MTYLWIMKSLRIFYSTCYNLWKVFLFSHRAFALYFWWSYLPQQSMQREGKIHAYWGIYIMESLDDFNTSKMGSIMVWISLGNYHSSLLCLVSMWEAWFRIGSIMNKIFYACEGLENAFHNMENAYPSLENVYHDLEYVYRNLENAYHGLKNAHRVEKNLSYTLSWWNKLCVDVISLNIRCSMENTLPCTLSWCRKL